jgi:hypothetical protein
VIPRTKHLGHLLRENHEGVSIVNAWQVWRLKSTVPEPYRRPGTGEWARATSLIRGLHRLMPGSRLVRGSAA